MDQEEAKHLLECYRPSGLDGGDPQFQEALALTRRDPELQRWFASQQDLSIALSKKLQEIPVPKDLKTKILTERIDHQTPRQHYFGRPLAIAAIVLILLTPLAYLANRFQPSRPTTYAALKQDMGNYLSGFYVLEKMSHDLDDLQTYLQSQHGLTRYDVPEALAQHPSIGCKIIEWHGQEIALICFVVEGEVVHLFAMDAVNFNDGPNTLVPEFEQVNEWATLTWTDAPKHYLVSTRGDEAILRSVFPPAQPL